MNGFPVVVFIDGRFDCVVLCATTDIAKAWLDGARFFGRYVGLRFTFNAADQFTAFLHQPGSLALFKERLDEEDQSTTIRLEEAQNALDAIERAKSLPFPTVPTIVK